MYSLICFLILLLILLVVYTMKTTTKPKNFPPGPAWYPITGCISELKKKSKEMGGQYKGLSALAAQYKTNVLGLKLGNDKVIAVFSYPVVRAVLKGSEYDGRPNNFFIKLRSMGKERKGITGTDGEFWSTQRKHLVRHLHNLGFGKRTMQNMIKDELTELISLIEKNGPEVRIGELITPSVLNVLWALTAGSRISRDDARPRKLLDLLRLRGRIFDMSGGLLNHLPWLRFFMPEKTGYNLIMNVNAKMRRFFMEAINEHYNNWTEGRNDDVIYGFISEMRKKTNATFTEHQLVMICLDIFVAGSQSTGDTLDFAFLMMLLHRDIQAKVQMQLDDVLGKSETLEYTHRQRLPYIDAVLLEVERFCHVLPITGPRRVLENTVLDGYDIPKVNVPQDTTVLISNYSVHMDKEYWGDPEKFRPERFLGQDGKLIASDRLVLFGGGKRRCLGEILAKNFIFVIFAGILREFSMEPVSGKPLPSAVPLSGITLAPEKYSANFVKRNL